MGRPITKIVGSSRNRLSRRGGPAMVVDILAGRTHTRRDDQKSRTDLGPEDRRFFARGHHPITAHLGRQEGPRGDQILDLR